LKIGCGMSVGKTQSHYDILVKKILPVSVRVFIDIALSWAQGPHQQRDERKSLET